MIPTGQISQTAPERILLIRPSALGDVCRTTPVLVSLKRHWPDARIDWLVQTEFAAAIEAHPDLHRVISFPRKKVAVSRWWRADARRLLRGLLGDLVEAHYDLVIDCQGLTRSSIFAMATRAPLRVGYANAAELGWLGLTHKVEIPHHLHTVDRMLGLVRAMGIPVVPDLALHVPVDAESGLPEIIDRARYMVFAPTSRWPGKRWPGERFATVAAELLATGAVQTIAIVAAESERAQCAPLLALAARDSRIVDMVGRTSVASLMAIIQRAALVLASDSAALHMAVGLHRPMVGLFGPTRVDLVGPYRRAHDVLQVGPLPSRNLHKDERVGREMMERITPGMVLDAIMQRLETETFHSVAQDSTGVEPGPTQKRKPPARAGG